MRIHRLKRSALAIALAGVFSAAWALPTGGTVASGAALLSNPSASVLQVVNTPGTIINWQSFSIGAGETTRFVQSGAQSAVLNRVTGASLSDIQGRLQSNGRVFLVNPNGILFGSGAVVDVAGLIASTRNISDLEFRNGQYDFDGRGAAASGAITLQDGAQITTTGSGGQVWLIAQNITQNAGSSISTPQGQTMLAAGTRIQVGEDGFGNMSFNVSTNGSATLQSLGSIAADRGAVGMFADNLTHQGSISADRGVIAINATRDLLIKDNARVIAANGTINLRGGNKLEIERLATVWADGASGSIKLESNDLRIYPWPDTVHANGGTVNYVLTNPGTLQVGSSTLLASPPEHASNVAALAVFLLSDGTVRVLWHQTVGYPNLVINVYTSDFSASGQLLGPAVLVRSGIRDAAELGGLAAQIQSLGVSAGAITTAEEIFRGTGFYPLATINGSSWPTSDGGRLVNPTIGSSRAIGTFSFSNSWTRLASSDASLNTIRTSGFDLASPLADGTTLVAHTGVTTDYSGQRFATDGSLIASDFLLSVPYSQLNGVFPKKDGGLTMLTAALVNADLGPPYSSNLTAIDITKVPAPYTASNDLTGTLGPAAGLNTRAGVSNIDGSLVTAIGNGPGASFGGIAGCNSAVCSEEIRAALAQTAADLAAAREALTNPPISSDVSGGPNAPPPLDLGDAPGDGSETLNPADRAVRDAAAAARLMLGFTGLQGLQGAVNLTLPAASVAARELVQALAAQTEPPAGSAAAARRDQFVLRDQGQMDGMVRAIVAEAAAMERESRNAEIRDKVPRMLDAINRALERERLIQATGANVGDQDTMTIVNIIDNMAPWQKVLVFEMVGGAQKAGTD